MLFQLIGDQVAFGNFHLFFHGITTDFDDFHAVEQGRLDGAQAIGGGNEQYLAQVVVHFQVIVVKMVVLGRVQHFEQCRTRVAPKITAYFINFIQQKYRIAATRLFHRLDDAARQGADVGFAVATDFTFVVQTTQRHLYKLPIQCCSDRAAQRGFTYPRRAY